MMGRYTIRAYGGRLTARISTERHEYTVFHSVSLFSESEKQPTERPIYFHIHFQTPTFLDRQSHAGRFHANRTIATERGGLIYHSCGYAKAS